MGRGRPGLSPGVCTRPERAPEVLAFVGRADIRQALTTKALLKAGWESVLMKRNEGLRRWSVFLGCCLLCWAMACPCKDCGKQEVCDNPAGCGPPECDKPEGCGPPECDKPEGCGGPECDKPEGCGGVSACDELEIPAGIPRTLVSFGKRTVTRSGGSAPMLVDGKFRDAAWVADVGDWVAIEVGGGMEELLLTWTSSGNYDHPEIRYGAPASYRIDTSVDGTDWREVLTVVGNHVRVRTHRIPFREQRWLRFEVLSKEGTGPEFGGVNGIRIDEIELHDNSDGKVDVWFFLGDSITAGAFTRDASQSPAFATRVWAADPSRYPLQMNGGYGGDTARDPGGDRPHSLARLRQALSENDGIRVVALALGTNDFGDIEGYRSAMTALVREVQGSGKVAIIPRIPWSAEAGRAEATQEAMNEVVDALTRDFGLPKGPDFYAHFKANPHHLLGEEAPEWSRPDWLHPNVEGNKAINCLWAEAAKTL